MSYVKLIVNKQGHGLQLETRAGEYLVTLLNESTPGNMKVLATVNGVPTSRSEWPRNSRTAEYLACTFLDLGSKLLELNGLRQRGERGEYDEAYRVMTRALRTR